MSKFRVNHEEGRIVFLFQCSNSYDFNETLELARKVAKDNVIIAVPKDINMISDEEIRKWKAIQDLMGKYKDDKKQRGLRKEQDKMKDGLKRSIEGFAAANNFVFVTCIHFSMTHSWLVGVAANRGSATRQTIRGDGPYLHSSDQRGNC